MSAYYALFFPHCMSVDFKVQETKEPTEVADQSMYGTCCSRVDAVILRVKVVVHYSWDDDINHLGQVVFK